VAGLGIQPNVELAEQAVCTWTTGIVVDELLRSSVPEISPPATWPTSSIQRSARACAWSTRTTPTRWCGPPAGRWPGRDAVHRTCRSSTRNLFALGYEAVASWTRRARVVSDWKEPFQEGVVYYLKEGRVRGVLLWGIFGK